MFAQLTFPLFFLTELVFSFHVAHSIGLSKDKTLNYMSYALLAKLVALLHSITDELN